MICEVTVSLWIGWSVAQGFPTLHVNHTLRPDLPGCQLQISRILISYTDICFRCLNHTQKCS